MASVALDDNLAAERALAVRELLASPMLDAGADRDEFRLVVRHAEWLVDYFEQACGWALLVDSAAGFARLAKRAVVHDSSRPLRRTRGEGAAFDRRRYELLCHVCAALVRHPVTTIGMLASAITAEARLDTSRHGERGALVDALRVLVSWGALKVNAGEVDAFVDSEAANALLSADTARLHRLIVSATAPSSLPDGVGVDQAIRMLAAEPRYGAAAEPGAIGEPVRGQADRRGAPDPTSGAPSESSIAVGDDARNRWARHRLARRVLDDPVVHLDEVSPAERDYLASISGRRWLRDRVAQAGFELEERAEGLLAVDSDGIATDARFPAPQGNAYQLALLLADRLVPRRAEGGRVLARLDRDQLHDAVRDVLARYPSWARGRRDGDGPDLLLAEAVDLLARFGLVRCEPDGAVVALPALARYAVGEPVVSDMPTLFEQE